MSVSSYARGGLGGSPDGLPAHQPKRVAGHKLPSLGTLPRPGRGISGADGAYQSKRAPRTLPPGVAIGSNTPGTTAPHLCRRSLLLLGGASVHLGLAEAADAHRQQIAVGSVAAAGSPTAAPQPLVDVPMARLRLPASTAGRDYVLVSLKIRGQGPFDFMVDSGLTAELITPHLKEVLGVRPAGKQHVTGLGAGGASPPGQVVELIEASLCGGRGSREELQLPPLHAVVQGFPQEHLDPGHDPVEGMLGMEVLSLFDADFDFPAGRLRLWPPGSAAEVSHGRHRVNPLPSPPPPNGIPGPSAFGPPHSR